MYSQVIKKVDGSSPLICEATDIKKLSIHSH